MSNSSSDNAVASTTSQWPVLGTRPNSMSMNNMLEDAIANMNLLGKSTLILDSVRG